jgi:DNA-binding NtrC family response regulator
MVQLNVIPISRELPEVLFIDADPVARDSFEQVFGAHMNVHAVADADAMWSLLAARPVHVVIADQRLPGDGAAMLFNQLRERHPRIRRVLVSAHVDLDAVMSAVNQGGVFRYFSKPWVNEQLVAAVREAHEAHRCEQEQDAYLQTLELANQQLEFALRQRLLS